ncbi:MAG: heme exporter protein B [Cyclobacteriaceae bacterium]|jgi:heme exporter protein B
MLAKEVKSLLYKEFLLELRQKHAINGILLYTLSTIFICYLSFDIKNTGISHLTWNALFWIIMLFSATSAVAKSFVQENQNRMLYYYTLVSPQGVILSKIIYNLFLIWFLSLVAIILFSLVLGNPVEDFGLFAFNLLLGSLGLSTTLTMVSAIASKASNNGILMAILSFPIMIPIILLVIKLSKNAIDGIARSESIDEVMTLCGINLIVGTLAFMLFPYLWRS